MNLRRFIAATTLVGASVLFLSLSWVLAEDTGGANKATEKKEGETLPKGVNYDDLDWENDLFLWKGEPYSGQAYAFHTKSTQKKMTLVFKAGKYHGELVEYYKNGQKKALLTYKDGVQHGKNIYWDEKGNVVKTRTWKNGEVVSESPDPPAKGDKKKGG